MWTEIPRHDPRYPATLAGVAGAPASLYVRGVWPSGGPVVAIVGARAASGHAIQRATDLAAELARDGAVVVSGGALGVDAAAHRGALQGGGPTLAVVAAPEGGEVYPSRNRPLFERIVSAGGAVVSPFPTWMRIDRWQFPKRNRVIAALADAVVVVEASAASGSLHTAAAGFELRKVVGACPGSAGCEMLLARGAALVEGAADVRAALAGRPRRVEREALAPGTDEALACAVLGAEPRSVEDVVARAGLPLSRAVRALAALELTGHARPAAGGRWISAQG